MKPNRLQNVLADLIEKGLVLGNGPINTKKVGRKRLQVELGDTSAIDDFDAALENSIKHFSDIVSQGRYSLMLCDGALCQIKYVLDGDEIIWHRFTYIPCLQKLDAELLAENNELAAIAEGDFSEFPRRAMLRFEFDPEAGGEDHPVSHLHLNTSSCRIPLRSSLGLGAFLDFLILYFYQDFDRQITAGFRSDFGMAMTITPVEQQQVHLNWISAAQAQPA